MPVSELVGGLLRFSRGGGRGGGRGGRGGVGRGARKRGARRGRGGYVLDLCMQPLRGSATTCPCPWSTREHVRLPAFVSSLDFINDSETIALLTAH